MTLWNLHFLWLRTRWRGGYYGPRGLVREFLLSGANLCTSRMSCGIGEAYTERRGFKFELEQHALTELVTISDLSLIVNLLFCVGLLDPKKPLWYVTYLFVLVQPSFFFTVRTCTRFFRWTSLLSTNTNSCIDVMNRTSSLQTSPNLVSIVQKVGKLWIMEDFTNLFL